MRKGRQSKNVEDATSGNYNPTPSATAAANQAFRSYYTNEGQTSRAQRNNAKALGMEAQTIRLQNDANKLEARKRTRVTPRTRDEQIKSFMARKK